MMTRPDTSAESSTKRRVPMMRSSKEADHKARGAPMNGKRVAAAAFLAIVTGVASGAPSVASTILADVQVGGGGSAVAEFLKTEGCVQRSVLVFASDAVFKQGPGVPTTEAGGLLLLSTADACRGSQTFGWG